MSVSFVTGGARSGKSRFAEQIASERLEHLNRVEHDLHKTESFDGHEASTVCVVATGVAMDGEMTERIRRHQETRPSAWVTVEESLDVDLVIQKGGYPVFVIDCLSLLLNNWMYELQCNEVQFRQRLDRLVLALTQSSSDCVVVSNEVGLGLVPPDAQSRQFRDWLGWMNQAVARVASHVYFVASGIAVDLRQVPGAVLVD